MSFIVVEALDDGVGVLTAEFQWGFGTPEGMGTEPLEVTILRDDRWRPWLWSVRSESKRVVGAPRARWGMIFGDGGH